MTAEVSGGETIIRSTLAPATYGTLNAWLADWDTSDTSPHNERNLAVGIERLAPSCFKVFCDLKANPIRACTEGFDGEQTRAPPCDDKSECV